MQLKWLGSKLLAIHQLSVAVSVLPIAKPGDTPRDTMSLPVIGNIGCFQSLLTVSYTHLRAHET